MILTEGQIKAQIRSIRSKTKATQDPVVFALRSDTPWGGASHLSIDGKNHRVAFCRSGLELREMLRLARTENESLVALCPFGTDKLEEDVVARLAKKRIHPPETRELLASLFQVTAVDPRVFATPALAQGLVENAPAEGYATVASGVLDLQYAWSALLGRVVGDSEVASNLTRVLDTSLDPVNSRRLESLARELRREFFTWGSQSLDRSVGWMAHLVDSKRTSDLVPIGLLLDVLFAPRQKTNASLTAARVRLESWFNGHSLDEGSARSWSAAARSLVHSILPRAGSGPLIGAILTRLDALFAELKIAEFAVRSDFSPAGFELRVRNFASALTACVEGAATTLDLNDVVQGLDLLRTHALANEHQRRIERCEMAARLAAWISAGSKLSTGTQLDDDVMDFVRAGGFVDWARTIVQEGSEPELNQAFDQLLARVNQVCDAFEASFASKLADWSKHGNPASTSFLPIEDALEKLVGPIAGQVPVLMLVMDGMSMSVFRELLGDVVQRGKWLETKPTNIPLPAALIATVPSITEISRRALFRGRLSPESTPTEQSAFSTNDRLFSLSGGQNRPTLFLKGDLHVAGEAGLATSVKTAIGNKKCRVVAMVLNAVDDHLSGSDQIAPRWDLDFVRPLREVLQLAAEAGRALIVTSDHGHVLEHKTVLRSGMSVGGDRYREDGGAAREGEIVVSGQRVQRAVGRPDLTVAWSRDVRYSGKKRGYHGGVNVQEMVVPVSVLRHLSSSLPDGWTDISPSPYRPDWWRLSAEAQPAVRTAAEAKATAGLDLFTHAAAKAQATDWIEQLLNGEIYAAQCSHAARGAPDRKLVSSFLDALSSRGGSMPRESLAERLGQPLLRVNGVVANLSRVFNVDGFEVVTVDNSSGTVSLNVNLLKKQFAIEK